MATSPSSLSPLPVHCPSTPTWPPSSFVPVAHRYPSSSDNPIPTPLPFPFPVHSTLHPSRRLAIPFLTRCWIASLVLADSHTLVRLSGGFGLESDLTSLAQKQGFAINPPPSSVIFSTSLHLLSTSTLPRLSPSRPSPGDEANDNLLATSPPHTPSLYPS